MPDALPLTTSASQLSTFANCGRLYFFRYLSGLEPEHRSVALVLGSAVHGAVGYWFEERLAGREPVLAQAEDVLSAELVAGSLGPPVRWQTPPASVDEEGRRLLRVYLSEMGALPVVAVERELEVQFADPSSGEVMPRRLRAFLDLVLQDGRVVELKTAGRSWNPATDVPRHLQLGAYAYAMHQVSGHPVVVEAHVLVKLKKEPRLQVFRVERSEHGWWLEAAVALERAIAAGNYPPSPGPLCVSCEFASACAAFRAPVTRQLSVVHHAVAV